jgi:hypothetical protein
MSRISMWNENKGNDYKWIDRQISEMYVTGGTGIGVHKYLGPMDQGPSTDATKPQYTTDSVTNIQDILFLENRDRKYDTDIYLLRGIYQRSDNDFDLTQFGLFLQTGTVIMTFHYNDMVATMGRKLMNGDVLELMHLKDYDVQGDLPAALKRYYVIGDCSWASEGFSPTWYPHLWRCKLNPLVDSQEYKDIMKTVTLQDSSGPMGTPGITAPLVDIMSTFKKYVGVNEAIVQQAENDVPVSGYDVSKIYSPKSDEKGKSFTSNSATYSPTTLQNPAGYLTGDGLAPNGLPVGAGIAFPGSPGNGDYFLRLDYLPNRLFRFSGTRWVKVEDNVRTNLTPGDPNNQTLRNSFANNSATITLSNGDVIPERQGLSQVLRPKADY